MDPIAALDEAVDAIAEGDFASAISRLGDYAEWRFKGGFEPPEGDRLWAQAMAQLADLMENMG